MLRGRRGGQRGGGGGGWVLVGEERREVESATETGVSPVVVINAETTSNVKVF